MAIDISGKTQETILANMLSAVSNKLDKREGSLIYTALAPIAYYLSLSYIDLKAAYDNTFIKTAGGEYLELITAERGINRNPAIHAVRRGKFNKTIPIGNVFTTKNGDNSLIYTIIELESKVSETEIYYLLKCNTAGVIGNSYYGEIVSNVYIQDLTVAELTDIIVNGEEAEEDEQLRQRYMESLNNKAFGGNVNSYRVETMAIEGVGAVQVYPLWQGAGTALIVYITNSYGIGEQTLTNKIIEKICPPEADNATPSANGYGLAPIGAKVSVKTADRLDINIAGKIKRDTITSLDEVKENIRNAVENYINNCRKGWGSNTSEQAPVYKCDLFFNLIVGAIVGSTGVINAVDITVNGGTSDIKCEQSITTQQLPILNELNFEEMDD